MFNGAVTGVVAHHVFAAGRPSHAPQPGGGVLLYLNIAALFAIAYGAIAMYAPGAFTGTTCTACRDGLSAVFTYFSLTTLTTTGFGDIVPTEPLTRSLANSGGGDRPALPGDVAPARCVALTWCMRSARQVRQKPFSSGNMVE